MMKKSKQILEQLKKREKKKHKSVNQASRSKAKRRELLRIKSSGSFSIQGLFLAVGQNNYISKNLKLSAGI
jgi:hypothetical protein